MNVDENLKSAICNNDLLFLQENLQKVDVNYVFEDEDGDSLLQYSISDAESEMYKYLLENGADINYKNHEGEGILHSAVYSGDVSRINALLKMRSFISIEDANKEGVTPLLLSVFLGKREISKYLIAAGADVNTKDTHNNTCLHAAAFDGDEEMVRILVEKGIDLYVKTEKGNIALALAVNNGHLSVIRYLYAKMYVDE